MKAVSLQELRLKNDKTLYKIIKRGRIFYFDYLLIENDDVKTISFIGLCVLVKKKYYTLQVKNLIKKEKISLTLHAHSPLISYTKRCKRYR
jgi:hypothetical protein